MPVENAEFTLNLHVTAELNLPKLTEDFRKHSVRSKLYVTIRERDERVYIVDNSKTIKVLSRSQAYLSTIIDKYVMHIAHSTYNIWPTMAQIDPFPLLWHPNHSLAASQSGIVPTKNADEVSVSYKNFTLEYRPKTGKWIKCSQSHLLPEEKHDALTQNSLLLSKPAQPRFDMRNSMSRLR